MTRYYLLAGYRLPIFVKAGQHVGVLAGNVDRKYCEAHGVTNHRNFTVLRLADDVIVRAVFHEWSIGTFMISKVGRRRAYQIADAIQGYFSLAFGYEPNYQGDVFYLQEVGKVPQPTWTADRFLNELQSVDPDASISCVHALQSGFGLDHHHLEYFAPSVALLLENERLREALVHFMQSRFLFYGHMVASYYDFHYSRDRAEAPPWLLEKRYFEQRARYELAFVAGFKALECFLGTTQVRANNVDRCFARLPFASCAGSTIYTRFHETFLGLEPEIAYRDLVVHFLELRNGVAAHANRSPPPSFLLSEDHLFELQLFVSKLILNALRESIRSSNLGTTKLLIHVP